MVNKFLIFILVDLCQLTTQKSLLCLWLDWTWYDNQSFVAMTSKWIEGEGKNDF